MPMSPVLCLNHAPILHRIYAPEKPRFFSGLVLVQWLIPLAPADQHLVGGGLEGEAEAEQALEGGGGVVPALEPEDELVEGGPGGPPAPPCCTDAAGIELHQELSGNWLKT